MFLSDVSVVDGWDVWDLVLSKGLSVDVFNSAVNMKAGLSVSDRQQLGLTADSTIPDILGKFEKARLLLYRWVREFFVFSQKKYVFENGFVIFNSFCFRKSSFDNGVTRVSRKQAMIFLNQQLSIQILKSCVRFQTGPDCGGVHQIANRFYRRRSQRQISDPRFTRREVFNGLLWYGVFNFWQKKSHVTMGVMSSVIFDFLSTNPVLAISK